MKQQTKFKQTELGKIPEDWEVDKIGNLVKINALSITKDFDFSEIEYIDIDSVDKGSINNYQNLKIKEAPSRAKRIIRDDDIIISTVRPNLKHFAFIKEAKPNTICSTGFAVITPRGVFPKYLYYFMTTDKYTYYLTSIADSHTSTYPSFNPEVIANSKICYPPLQEQKSIAKILSNLDEKIELNNKINKILETIGQVLFKKSFLDNPDKEKWRVSTIGQDLKTILGGTPDRTNSAYWHGDINWINSGKINEFRILEPSEKITELGLNNSATKLLPKGTVVLAITGATLGQVSRLEIESCANQSVIGVLENEKLSSEYLYYWIKEEIFRIISHQTGAAQQHINKTNVDNYKILIPDKETLEKFNKIIKPIFNQISINCFQSQKLSKIRDLLLPKLMSGEIRLK